MSQEEFKEPNEEEVGQAVASAEDQMNEYKQSLPTPENVSRVVKEVAAQFGEKFEMAESTSSEQEIVQKYEKDGWDLIAEVDNTHQIDIVQKEGKEIKIIGLGNKFLIFQKEERKKF